MRNSFLLAFILFASLVFAKPNVQVAKGRFDRVEAGDYVHLILLNDKKGEMEFICGDLPKALVKGFDCNDLRDKPNKFKDKILKVTFHEETRMIPEAGTKVTWKYVDRIDFE